MKKFRLAQHNRTIPVLTLVLCLCWKQHAAAQAIPGAEQGIEFLCTFGKASNPYYGDDDFSQTFFFVIPKNYKQPFFVRIFDPEVGGKHDLIKNTPNTQTGFYVYGGSGAYSNKNARGINPKEGYKSGILLQSKVFSNQGHTDNQWVSIGPFIPNQGEFDKDLNGYVFKIICEGISGDDGNLYNYFLSSSQKENKHIEGANSFTYEISFRLPLNSGTKCHIYPFVDNNIISITQYNFDMDDEAELRINSVSKNHVKLDVSGNGDWASTKYPVTEEEKNTSLDIQFIKLQDRVNDVTFYMMNQYNEAIPLYSSPIGGKPKYKYKVDIIINTKAR
ncbi:MAG: hypothetical protein EP338_11190 [Bacteroidetes bacterium]|nr:MAG: hypothetical protein EP338_11190 [Bacteroidota bacterium]